MASPVPVVHSSWHYHFENFEYETTNFYDLLRDAINERNIPGLRMKRIDLSQGSVFMAKREYLRVFRDEYVFDICAAPFGTGFFVSWWLGESESFSEKLSRVPLIKFLVPKGPRRKTYFELDSAYMFKESISRCVLEVVDYITEEKGIRKLTDEERKFNEATVLA